MMKKNVLFLILTVLSVSLCVAQTSGSVKPGGTVKDSTAFAKAVKDSLAQAKAARDSIRFARLFSIEQYPYIKGSKWSGVIPVADPTEVPDLKQRYKLLFEIADRNPDSLSKEINSGLEEVARLLNLHVASGIPPENITSVVVLHGGGIEPVMNNESYKKKHSIDNPNIRLVNDLQKIGARIIVCGQAMAFHDTKKEDLLPGIKISLTAQTVLSNYQLQGYILYSIKPDK